MSERKSLSGGDWLSIGVFFVGTAVAVLMSYGLWTGAGGESGTAALGALIAGSIGPWPALIGGAGIALLGGRAFLTGDRTGLGSGILGALGVAVGLSVVAGSLSADRGGALGAGTGGRVAEMTHAAVGVLLGAIVAFGAAYFAWMREDPTAAAKLAPARRLTPAPPKSSDDGVTAAESAMLFPGHPDEEQAPPARPIPAPVKPVKPLYPEDVRLKGEIPTGAKPLTPPAASAAAPAIPVIPEPAVYRWTAPRATSADATRIAPEEIEALADAAPPVPEPIAQVEEAAETAEEADARPMPPRPTWETTGLTEEDEPVDAYGTPLSLVEKARRDRDEAVEAEEADDDVGDVGDVVPVTTARIPREIGALETDEDLDAEPLDADEETEEPVVAPTIAVAVVGEVGGDADGSEEAGAGTAAAVASGAISAQDALLQALRANNAAARAEAAVVDEYDTFELEVAQAEESAAEEVLAEDVLAEADELELDEEDLEGEDLVEEEAVEVTAAIVEVSEAESGEEVELALAEAGLDEAEDADEDIVDDLAEDFDEELEPDEEAPEPEPIVVATPARTKVAAAAPSLFDAVEPEPEVVLQPRAAVPASRAEKAPGRGIDPEKKLLVEVGCMFVERGRVAVSMLQRQYDMDFDQACRVLDDLQELGLIGPYMGGKNRDILLTKEQWLDRVGVA